MKLKTLLTTLVLAATSTVNAAPISFTFTGAGDLTLDGVAHNSTAFSVVINAYTDNITSFALDPTSLLYEPVSATLNLGTLGSGTFNDDAFVFNAPSFNGAGFGTDAGGDLFALFSSALGSYDMISTLSEITGTPDDPGQWVDIDTTLGLTSFSNFTRATFSADLKANAVSAPATILLIGAGLFGLAGTRLRPRP